MTRICIVQGHPTAEGGHFCHALAQAYADGAGATAHEVKTLSVATMDFPQLRTKEDWDTGRPPIAIVEAQATGFAMALTPNGGWTKLLAGRSARVIVTMGMPAVVYRWYFGAPGLKSLTQNLALVGIKPRRPLLVGSIEAMGDARRRNWLQRLHRLGREAA